MKNKLLILSLLAAGLSMGCKPATEKTPAPTTMSQSMDKAQVAANDMMAKTQDFAFAQKAEFVASLQTKLSDQNRNVDDLSAKIEKSTDAIKNEAKPKIASLRDQAIVVGQKLTDVTNSTAANWAETKAASEKACMAFADSVTQSSKWAAERIGS